MGAIDPDGPYADALLADGFGPALVGFGFHFNAAVAIYDYVRCIAILVERDGMSEEDAVEFFEFNVAGAWVGPNTPVFMTHLEGRNGWMDMDDAGDHVAGRGGTGSRG
tara:strand:+ start:168 stop:491 length:324 start_codon:yes stop_codon:yes gene_type:complete